MGIEEKNKKVMWYGVYRELAKLLAKINGEKLYERCFGKEFGETFQELNMWAKKFSEIDDLETLDPMHVFASCNSSRMREELRLNRIHLYFEILGMTNSREIYKNIDFSGCPSPVTIALMSARKKDTQDEIWKVFKEFIGTNSYDENKEYFDLTQKWYGIAIESFTLLLFWIDAKNFLPLDKNTIGLLKKYNKISQTPKKWQEYQSLLTEKDTYLYIDLAFSAWDGQIEVLEEERKVKIEEYLGLINLVGVSHEFKLIAIGLDSDYKGLKKSLYTFDKAYKIDKETIEYQEEKDINLYNLDNVNINIVAIVGKNGTGKSTLMELLLKKLYYIKNNNKCEELPMISIYIKSLNLYKIELNNNNDSKIYKVNEADSRLEVDTSEKLCSIIEIFYNFLLNYSIHGLNSTYNSNVWIEKVKENDLITIEPKRKKGVIDINEVDKKLLYRVVCNILEQEDENYSFRELIKGTKATRLLSKCKSFKIKKGIEFSGTKKTSSNKDLFYEYDIEKLSNTIDFFLGENDSSESSIKSLVGEDSFFDLKLDNEVRLNDLSSGEKQKIYTINSIAYQIKEINNKGINFANIILDEIELYFHPEFQREYISNLIHVIKQVPTDKLLGINITFITHSPFILSDIPESKILFLDKEGDNIEAKTISKNNNVKTFGANIHTLLSNSFFMENGLLGEFSKNKINEIIKNLKDEDYKPSKEEKEQVLLIIKSIGEAFLRSNILDMYNRKFIEDYKDREKEKVKKQIDDLNKKLKELDND